MTEEAANGIDVVFARVIVDPSSNTVEIYVTDDPNGSAGGATNNDYGFGNPEFEADLEKIRWMAERSSHRLHADPSGGKLNLRKS